MLTACSPTFPFPQYLNVIFRYNPVGQLGLLNQYFSSPKRISSGKRTAFQNLDAWWATCKLPLNQCLRYILCPEVSFLKSQDCSACYLSVHTTCFLQVPGSPWLSDLTEESRQGALGGFPLLGRQQRVRHMPPSKCKNSVGGACSLPGFSVGVVNLGAPLSSLEAFALLSHSV